MTNKGRKLHHPYPPPDRTPAPLTPDVVAYIRMLKSQLWYGRTLLALSKAEDMSLSYLGNIRSGQRYPTVRWPDGKSGAMPAWRKKQIAVARRVAKTKLDDMVEKILRAADQQAAGGALPRNDKGQIVGNVRGSGEANGTMKQEQEGAVNG